MKNYKLLILITALLVMGSLFSMQADAALQNLGMDSRGNRLIYDTDLDITWYDFSNSLDTWQNQVKWSSDLTLDFGGNIYSDWRLPTAVDGLYDFGYDGSTTGGYNIESSEMGHLFYEELSNTGRYDTSGNPTGCGGTGEPSCLTDTGYFQNLQTDSYYWSGTEYSDSPGNAWNFSFNIGFQSYIVTSKNLKAFAVRDGLAVAPEPVSSILFIAGGVTLGFRSFRKKFRK